MSAALMEIVTPEVTPRKRRKNREASNRIVTNLTSDYTWLVRVEAKEAGIPPAALVRLLCVEAYRARGLTPKQVKAQYLTHLAAVASGEAEAELGDEDLGDEDE